MEVIVVTGSREPSAKLKARVERVLSKHTQDLVLLIHGDATGADQYAKEFAWRRGWAESAFGYVRKRGNAGGPFRNGCIAHVAAACKSVGDTVTCYAFPEPSSRGTWDCRDRLTGHGLAVHVIRS